MRQGEEGQGLYWVRVRENGVQKMECGNWSVASKVKGFSRRGKVFLVKGVKDN